MLMGALETDLIYQYYVIRSIVTVTVRARIIYKWYQIGTTIFYEDKVASHFGKKSGGIWICMQRLFEILLMVLRLP